MEFKSLSPAHGDAINDIAFDYYGKRFASCGNDKEIKIWDLIPQDESEEDKFPKWHEQSIPRAHQDSIWRISWAHPEFGQLFASCSQDKTVHIWEEQESVSLGKSDNREKWVRKMQLTDSKGSVNDVKFAPRHQGLKLATGSADGFVRIYEATDVFALNYWPLQDTIIAENVSPGVEYDTHNGVTCLSWSECPFEPPKLVVGGNSGRAIVWSYNSGKWVEEVRLEGHSGPLYDISWAPVMGRSFHLIASADRTSSFRMFKLKRGTQGHLTLESSVVVNASSPVWRVAWNATGTILATSTEDGQLDLWKKDFDENWVVVQSIPGEAQVARNYYKYSNM